MRDVKRVGPDPLDGDFGVPQGRGASAPGCTATVRVVGSCLALQGVICRLCELSCEANAIHLVQLCGGYARPEVTAARCTGCGLCLSVCPGGALAISGPSQ